MAKLHRKGNCRFKSLLNAHKPMAGCGDQRMFE